MTKHWRPRDTREPWLSPDAYNALSRAEKRALAFERRKQRHFARYTPAPARYRKGYYARQRWTWLGFVLLFGLLASRTGLDVPTSWFRSAASAPVAASFDYCKWGGGTNCVVDGDTFWIEGQKVRIAGIDAPETHDYGCESELSRGNEATEKLHALLNSGAVTMTGIDRDRDVYGRLLRNVAVNGEDVGEAMISAGVARRYGSGRQSWC